MIRHNNSLVVNRIIVYLMRAFCPLKDIAIFFKQLDQVFRTQIYTAIRFKEYSNKLLSSGIFSPLSCNSSI